MTLLGPLYTTPDVAYGTGPVTTSTLINLLNGGRTHAGPSVSEPGALAMPVVWRCVNLVAGTVASLPLHAYATAGTGRSRKTGTWGPNLLDEPHPDLTPFEFWEIGLAHLLLWGNAYFRILRNGVGRPVELWPIDPATVQVGRSAKIGRKLYTIAGDLDSGGLPVVHDDETVLHIPGFGYDGICGVSPIRMARQGIALGLAAEEYGAKLFGNGALATGILQTEQRLTQAQADQLSTRWKEKRTGLKSAHETVVLDKGATFQQISVPPEDAQFIESRKFQTSEIARFFGVPPHMVGDTEKSTSWGTGIEQQTLGFVVYTLRPWLTRIEQRVSRLIKGDGAYARFALEGLLRGDSAQRAAFYRAMWEMGALSTNDILALEERDPVPGGETRYRPLNFGLLGSYDDSQGAAAARQEATP